MQQIRRIQRHGNGREIRIPTPVCRALKVRAGDYLLFDYEFDNGSVTLSKVQTGGANKGQTNGAKATDTVVGRSH